MSPGTRCTLCVRRVGGRGGSGNVNRFASSFFTMKTRCNRRAYGSWARSCSFRSPWRASFCREGLQSLEEDDDMLTAMARELVTQRGIGESANEVWRQIQAEQTRLPVPTASIEEATTVGEPPLVAPFSIPVNVDAPKFGARPPSGRPLRRKEPLPAD